MKAIVIHRNLDEIIDGLKTTEYRALDTEYRGPVLLCAPETRTHRTRAVAVADLAVCGASGGVFAWSYHNPVEILPVEILPVGVKATSGLFDVPVELDEIQPLETFGDDWQGPVEEALGRLKKTRKNKEVKHG